MQKKLTLFLVALFLTPFLLFYTYLYIDQKSRDDASATRIERRLKEHPSIIVSNNGQNIINILQEKTKFTISQVVYADIDEIHHNSKIDNTYTDKSSSNFKFYFSMQTLLSDPNKVLRLEMGIAMPQNTSNNAVEDYFFSILPFFFNVEDRNIVQQWIKQQLTHFPNTWGETFIDINGIEIRLHTNENYLKKGALLHTRLVIG